MNQTPSATRSATARSLALRTASGTLMSTAALGLTSVTLRSSTCQPPWVWLMRIGKRTPPPASRQSLKLVETSRSPSTGLGRRESMRLTTPLASISSVACSRPGTLNETAE